MSSIQVECGIQKKEKEKRFSWGSLRRESSVEPATDLEPGYSTESNEGPSDVLLSKALYPNVAHGVTTTKTTPTLPRCPRAELWLCSLLLRRDRAVTVLHILPPKCFRRGLLRRPLCTSGPSLDQRWECISRRVGRSGNMAEESLNKEKNKRSRKLLKYKGR